MFACSLDTHVCVSVSACWDPGLCPRADGRCPVSVFFPGAAGEGGLRPPAPVLGHLRMEAQLCAAHSGHQDQQVRTFVSQEDAACLCPPAHGQACSKCPEPELSGGDGASLVRTNPTEKIQSTSWVRLTGLSLGGRPSSAESVLC